MLILVHIRCQMVNAKVQKNSLMYEEQPANDFKRKNKIKIKLHCLQETQIFDNIWLLYAMLMSPEHKFQNQ